MDLSPSSHCPPIQIPNRSIESHADPCLSASNASFKREKRRKRKEKKRQEKLEQLLDNWTPLAGQYRHVTPRAPSPVAPEWPLAPVADQNPDRTSWGFKPERASPTEVQPPVHPDDLAHQTALKSCREFFALDDSHDEEDGVEEDYDSNGGKSFQFFKTLFEEEGNIRDVYQRDWANGGFSCLVCDGAGEKLGKRFIGLSGLVQHANFILKTKRRMAHRAYARVVCELLGWEIDRLQGSTIDRGDDDKQY